MNEETRGNAMIKLQSEIQIANALMEWLYQPDPDQWEIGASILLDLQSSLVAETEVMHPDQYTLYWKELKQDFVPRAAKLIEAFESKDFTFLNNHFPEELELLELSYQQAYRHFELLVQNRNEDKMPQWSADH